MRLLSKDYSDQPDEKLMQFVADGDHRAFEVPQADDPARGAEQVDLLAQTVRHRHRSAIAPELGVVPLRDMIVQDQKIPDRGVLEVKLGVELPH